LNKEAGIAVKRGFMKENERRGEMAGRPFPVFIAGIRYRSVFAASVEAGISEVWILKTLKSSGGFPVVIKRLMVATEKWARERAALIGGGSES
jgi:hypothetical protein